MTKIVHQCSSGVVAGKFIVAIGRDEHLLEQSAEAWIAQRAEHPDGRANIWMQREYTNEASEGVCQARDGFWLDVGIDRAGGDLNRGVVATTEPFHEDQTL